MSVGQPEELRKMLKKYMTSALIGGDTSKEHFLSTYTRSGLTVEEVNDLQEGRNEDKKKAAEDKLKKDPEFIEVTEGFEKIMNSIINKLGESHGACMFCALSMLSGLGTDQILSPTGALVAKGKSRGKGKRSFQTGRDSATTIADGARFLNQMDVTSGEARGYIANLVTGSPTFDKERARAILFEIFACSAKVQMGHLPHEEYFMCTDDFSGRVETLSDCLVMAGLPETGYFVRRPASKIFVEYLNERHPRAQTDQAGCQAGEALQLRS